MTRDYKLLSRPELESALVRLKAELEDLKETVSFYFSNSAAHIKGGEVMRYEESLNELKCDISEIEGLMSRERDGLS
jgi:hypothetical protein